METASLLLNVFGLGPPLPDGAGLGPITEGGCASSTSFQQLVWTLLGGSTADGEADRVWAGQQVLRNQKEEKADAGDESAEMSALGQYLLGSMAASTKPPETASLVESNSTPQPSVQIRAIADAATPVQIGVLANPAPRSSAVAAPEALEYEPTEQSVPIQSEIEPTSTLAAAQPPPRVVQTHQAKPVTAEVPILGAEAGISIADRGSAVPAAGIEVEVTAKPEVETQRKVEVAVRADPKAAPQPADAAPEADRPVLQHELDALLLGGTLRVPRSPSRTSPVPPDAVAPQQTGHAADRAQPARRKELPTVPDEADPRASYEALAARPAAGSRSERVDLGSRLPENAAPDFRRLITVRPIAEIETDLAAVSQPPSRIQPPREAPQDRVEQGTTWVPVPDQPLPGFRAVEAVAGSNAHLPPDHVISAKVINQIVRAAKVHLFEGGGELFLRLDPPHLGVVHMSVTSAQGTVTASLQTSTESAKLAIESDLSALRQALADAGINVDSISVTVGGSSNQTWSLHAGADDWSAEGQSRGGGWHARAHFGAEAAAEPVTAARAFASGRLDYLA